MAKIIGIDLGTTNSVVATVEDGTPKVLVDDRGMSLLPSVVGFGGPELLIGFPAKNQVVLKPESTVFSIKRFMGRRRNEVSEEETLVPYAVVGESNDFVKVMINGRVYTPQEISAHILKALKARAESYLGELVDKAVITVPAYFNDSQRQATKDAGALAGLTVERIINEPTASALAYGLEKKKQAKIAVFDLGGGTFDISLLELSEGVFEVLATNGDTHLGGDDFDHRIVKWMASEFENENGFPLPPDPMTGQKMRLQAERVKCQLSFQEEAEINLPFLHTASNRVFHFNNVLTRKRLEELIADLINRLKPPCAQAMRDAKLAPDEIDEVILVGGSTRMPIVRTTVQEIFGKQPNTSVNPDEVVALGAAIQGSVLSGDLQDVLLLDVTPLSLGIEIFGGAMEKLIHRNTTIPTSVKENFTTFYDGQTSVDIHVLQGEREMAADNRTLGRFRLEGFPPLAAGAARIEVILTIDANGILNVEAKELSSGVGRSIQVNPSSGLNEQKIEKLVLESVEYAVEDMKKRMLAETRIEADRVIQATEKSLSSYGHLVSAGETELINAALKKCRLAKDGEEIDAIKEAIKELDQATSHLAQLMLRESIRTLNT